MMKNAKQHETIDQGASDKGDSPKRAWSFFPKTMAEVPSVEVLRSWGRKNLQYMSKHWEAVLAKSGSAATCLLSTDVIYRLMQNIGQALVMADDAFPLIPDLRLKDNWAEVGETIVSYEIICAAGMKYRRLKPYKAKILSLTKSEIPPETREVNVQIIDADENCKFEQTTYDLYSPYIMKTTEVTYFGTHPDAMAVWADLCGTFYPLFRINEEMQGVLRHYFSTTKA